MCGGGCKGLRSLPELLFDFTPGQVVVKSFHISLMFPQYLLLGTVGWGGERESGV